MAGTEHRQGAYAVELARQGGRRLSSRGGDGTQTGGLRRRTRPRGGRRLSSRGGDGTQTGGLRRSNSPARRSASLFPWRGRNTDRGLTPLNSPARRSASLFPWRGRNTDRGLTPPARLDLSSTVHQPRRCRLQRLAVFDGIWCRRRQIAQWSRKRRELLPAAPPDRFEVG